jgi:O-succinylhomoserine sulfhydrylase
MKRHSESALEIATKLSKLGAVESVRYPFLASHPQYELAQKQMSMGGGIVCFAVKGGRSEATQFIDRLKLLSITANLGDSRTIVTHPATTTHSKLSINDRQAVGITDNLIRISVGLEHPNDIFSDICQALS